MKKLKVTLWLCLLFACSTTLFAATPEGLSPEQLNSLATIKHKINGVRELAAAGVLTAGQAESATNKYLSDAKSVADRRISLEELSNVPDGTNTTADSTWISRAAERLAGWMTFGNTVVTLGVLGLVAGFLIIFRQAIIDLLRIFKDIPVIVYEVLVYAFGLSMVGGGRVWSPEYGHFVGLFGCLILSGGVGISFWHHARARKNSPSVFFLVLTVIFIAGALYHSSALIGGFGVFCLIGALSFEDALDNLAGFIGFENEGALGRVTTVSYVMIAGHILVKTLGIKIPALQIFEPGMLYLGSLGGYTGILISAGYWYTDKFSRDYLSRQIMAIIFGAGMLICGLILGMPVMQKIGGTFFALYLLEKLLEIISLFEIRSAYTLGGLIIFLSAMLAGAGMLVIRNQDFFSKYLLFI